MLKKITKLFGNENERILKRYHKVVLKINMLEPQMEALSDEEFPSNWSPSNCSYCA